MKCSHTSPFQTRQNELCISLRINHLSEADRIGTELKIFNFLNDLKILQLCARSLRAALKPLFYYSCDAVKQSLISFIAIEVGGKWLLKSFKTFSWTPSCYRQNSDLVASWYCKHEPHLPNTESVIRKGKNLGSTSQNSTVPISAVADWWKINSQNGNSYTESDLILLLNSVQQNKAENVYKSPLTWLFVLVIF